VSAEKAGFLLPDELVVSVVAGGEAKAYPLRVLNWHEVVNDNIGGRPVAVTYCPLTASAVAYDRRLAGKSLSFGVSGKLYESNLLFYDRESQSLWSQLGAHAVAGPLTGSELKLVASQLVTWRQWREEHPDGLVLSLETGYARDYSRNPYSSYEHSDSLMFPVVPQDRRLLPKEKVLGIVVDGRPRAYPLAALEKVGNRLEERLGSRVVSVRRDPLSGQAHATADGEPVVSLVTYWFAWFAFHPDTEIWGERVWGGGLGSDRVVVSGDKGSWSSLLGILGGELHRADSDMYLITGEVRNVSGKDLAYARLIYELFDGQGRVLFREYGYNRSAERLRDPEFEFGGKSAAQLGVEPLKAGARDRFRMVFFTDEIPRFDHYRISVAAAPFAEEAAKSESGTH